MASARFLLIILFTVIAYSFSNDTRSFYLSITYDREYQCVNTICLPFTTMIVSDIQACQMACLDEAQCQTVNFYQSTHRCDLFVQTPDQNTIWFINVDSVFMTVETDTKISPLICNPICATNHVCVATNTCSCPTGLTGSSDEQPMSKISFLGTDFFYFCSTESLGTCFNNVAMIGNSVFLITFGRDTPQYSSVIPTSLGFSTNYTQTFSNATGIPFAIVNSIPNAYPTWHIGSLDHTPNDTHGYMLLFNTISRGEYLRIATNNLCIGSRYEFSFYAANLARNGTTSSINPNINIQVKTKKKVIANSTTDSLLKYDALNWKQYGVSFIALNNSVVFMMIGTSAGGPGNDFVIDDIALRTCSTASNTTCP